MAVATDLNKTDGDIIYASDISTLMTSYGRLIAREAYQGNISDASGDEYFKTEKYTTASANTGTTALWVDADDAYELGYTDAASGDTTHDPSTSTDLANAFDNNDATYAYKTFSLSGSPKSANMAIGKTFTAKYVAACKIKATGNYLAFGINTGGVTVALETYDGATWTNHTTLGSASSTANGSVSVDTIVNINATISGIRVNITSTNHFSSTPAGVTQYLYTLEYGDYASSSIVKENAVFSKNPDSMIVYGRKLTPTNTTITFDISDDGGSTYAITGQTLDTKIDTSALTGSSIGLKFNLSTTDTSVTPKLYGYSAVILDT